MTTVTSEKTAEILHRLWHTARGRAEPAPHYRRLHQLGPVLVLPDGRWIIVGYAAAKRVLSCEEFGTDWDSLMHTAGLGGRWRTHPSLRLVSRLLMSADGDSHTRLRHHAIDCIRPFLAGLDGRMSTYASELTHRLATNGGGDLVSNLAVPLGLQTLTDLVGSLDVDSAELVALIKAFNRALDPVDRADVLTEADHAAVRLQDVVGVRLACPDTKGVLGALRLRVLSGQLGHDDAVALAIALLGGAYDTPIHLVANGLALLLNNSSESARVRAQPHGVSEAVEEALRYDPPVTDAPRTALKSACVSGTTLPAGAQITVLIGAANRDTARYVAPDTFTVGRKAPAPLTFGAGRHYCPGAHIARMLAKNAYQAVITGPWSFVLAGKPEYPDLLSRRTVRRLMVRMIR